MPGALYYAKAFAPRPGACLRVLAADALDKLATPCRHIMEAEMELSARNQLQGTVRSVTLGNVMAEVVVDVNGQEIVSAITRGSAERLGLSEGSAVTVVIKSTDVLLATEHA
jgi:molybdopterin-binding protein